MKKELIYLLLLALLLVSCQKEEIVQEMGDMSDMPCHQMPDGSMMGDCDENTMKGEEMQMMQPMYAEGFLPNNQHNIESLPLSKNPSIVELEDGDAFSLSADVVRHSINGNEYVMYGYNKQIPGPIIKVAQDATITVAFTNNINQETTIHWHGLRHDNKDDGVPGVSQQAVQHGETFMYTVYFPDAGIYWYHPHVREDLQQDLGLAGNMFVYSTEDVLPVNHEEILILDDILLDDGKMVPYGEEHANFALMGRFGNTLLINGQTDYFLDVNKGDVVRFYITNVANVRPFNIFIDGAEMKLIGSDLGMYEQEMFIDNIIIAPAERYIVDVYFKKEGTYEIYNKNPEKSYNMGRVVVSEEKSIDDHSTSFEKLQTTNMKTELDSFKKYFDKSVDYTLDLTVEMQMMHNMERMEHEEEDGIEWEDSMPMMNRQMTTEDVTWIIRNKDTKKENMDFIMEAKVGDVLKIQLVNDLNSEHPMQHPMHLHGQRFLVLNEDGVKNDNLVWKDTVLVPSGKTVDILVDVTNPGEWMMHCHIAEHLEAGMMTSLIVS